MSIGAPSPNESATEQNLRSPSSNSRDSKQLNTAPITDADQPHPTTPLQRRIAIRDQDNYGIIWPLDVYAGFRTQELSVLFSTSSLPIPLFFSYLEACYEGSLFWRIADGSRKKDKAEPTVSGSS